MSNAAELIQAPTRKDPVSGRESALDHIWTNAKNVLNFGTVTGLSDHDGIFVKFSLEKEKRKISKIKIRNFKKFNEKSFTQDLERNFAKSNINELIKGKLANEATSEFTKIFTDTLDFHAPFIEILPKEKNVYIPWYNDELRTKIKIKKEILKDSRTLGKDLFKERLKKITNTINFLKKFLKQKYILDELEKANQSETP